MKLENKMAFALVCLMFVAGIGVRANKVMQRGGATGSLWHGCRIDRLEHSPYRPSRQ